LLRQFNTGFHDETTAKQGCASLTNDACCTTLFRTTTGAGGSLTIPTDEGSEKTNSFPVVIVAVSIIGGVLLISLAIGLFIWYRSKKAQQIDTLPSTVPAKGGLQKKNSDFDLSNPANRASTASFVPYKPSVSRSGSTSSRGSNNDEPSFSFNIVKRPAVNRSSSQSPLLNSLNANSKSADKKLSPSGVNRHPSGSSFNGIPAGHSSTIGIPSAPSPTGGTITIPSAVRTPSQRDSSASSATFSPTIPASNPENFMHVIHPYSPTLADELPLEVGQEVILLKSFDDGWALGLSPTTGIQGAFPLVCVVKMSEFMSGRVSMAMSTGTGFLEGARISRRVSSAYFSPEELAALAAGAKNQLHDYRMSGVRMSTASPYKFDGRNPRMSTPLKNVKFNSGYEN
jgi:hypothetical protein